MQSPPSESTDFYSEDIDVMTRGALLLQSRSEFVNERMMHGEISVDTPVSKQTCLRFPYTASAPMKPTDPLYVFPRWSFYGKSENVSELANLVVDGIEGLLSKRCRIQIKNEKVKISIETDSGLSVKIKFFALPESPKTYFVVFRKDAGDWFAFNSVVSASVKYLISKGMSLEDVQGL